MASTSTDDFIVLELKDPIAIDAEITQKEIFVSTTEICGWNLPLVLSHHIVQVQANRNRLVQQSSYFRGLLSGSFSESYLDRVSIEWNLEAVINVLKFIFGCQFDLTSNNFLPLLEGALFFGVESLLLECRTWFSMTISSRGLRSPQIPLDAIIEIWNFGLEHAIDYITEPCTGYFARNFMWAMLCSSFADVPYNLLCSCMEHPHLTVDSERHLCEALLVWLASNAEPLEHSINKENDYTDILKKVRLGLLPLWFAAGKRRNCYFSKLADESSNAILGFVKDPFTSLQRIIRDGGIQNFRIRLTEYTEKVDLSGCPQITSAFMLSVLCSYSMDPSLAERVARSLIELQHFDADKYSISRSLIQDLSFETVHEVDMSKCPGVHFEAAIEFFELFPSLRTLKALFCLHFKMTTLFHLIQKCPLVNEVDLTTDVSPAIPTRVSTISASIEGYKDLGASYKMLKEKPLSSNISKLTLKGRSDINGVDVTSLVQLMSQTYLLKSLCLRRTLLVDDALYNFLGSSLERFDVSDTMVSGTSLSHIIRNNPGLTVFKARGCRNLSHCGSKREDGEFPPEALPYPEYFDGEDLYFELGRTCILEVAAFGWGLSPFSLKNLGPSGRTMRAITVGLGASLGDYALTLLPTISPLLESVVLYFQVISDSVVKSIVESLKHLKVLALCYCLGDLSLLSFQFSMPNLRKLRLERVTPWMKNDDLVILTRSCTNLIELSLSGCTHLTSDSQQIISYGWPGLISIHLEDCGEVTGNGVSSLFDCKAIEDLSLRHNGCGIQRNFIVDAASKMPMLRKVALDLCDASEGGFDSPSYAISDRFSLSTVKLARCKQWRSPCNLQNLEVYKMPVHKETIVLEWNSEGLKTTVVKERV